MEISDPPRPKWGLMVILGLVFMIIQRIREPEYFRRKLEVVDPAVLASAPAGGAR